MARGRARRGALGLKPHFVAKYRWAPVVIDTEEAVDIVVTLSGKALGDRPQALRLRHLPDWEIAGRRETFVDPEDHAVEGRQFWPSNGIRGITPTICRPASACAGSTAITPSCTATSAQRARCLLGFFLELEAVTGE